jgi:hypothetical protein
VYGRPILFAFTGIHYCDLQPRRLGSRFRAKKFFGKRGHSARSRRHVADGSAVALSVRLICRRFQSVANGSCPATCRTEQAICSRSPNQSEFRAKFLENSRLIGFLEDDAGESAKGANIRPPRLRHLATR